MFPMAGMEEGWRMGSAQQNYPWGWILWCSFSSWHSPHCPLSPWREPVLTRQCVLRMGTSHHSGTW